MSRGLSVTVLLGRTYWLPPDAPLSARTETQRDQYQALLIQLWVAQEGLEGIDLETGTVPARLSEIIARTFPDPVWEVPRLTLS